MPNNITITEITSPSKLWEVSYNVDSAGAKIANLMTSGTFLDRNIGIKITTPAGSATGPSSLSGSGATLSTGTNTLTFTKQGIDTTPTVTAGYVTTATSSSATVTLTASVTTKEATTYNVSTTDQTIAGNQYLIGTQTIRKVTTNNIDANKIKSGVTVTVGDSGSATRIKNVTGTFTSSSTVSSGQIAATATHILTGYSAWVNGEEIKGTLNGSASQTATVTVTGSGTATTPTITRITTGASNIGSGLATTTAPSSGYFVAMKATAPVTTLTMTKIVNQAGLLTGENQITATATTSAKDSGTYYITVPSGDYSASVESHTITKPTITPSIGGNITGITQTSVPSGSNGTDYWTIDPGGFVTTNGSSKTKAKATISSGGYISADSKTSSESSIILNKDKITITTGINRYLLKASTTSTSGTASATANAGTASITTYPTATATTTITTSGISGGYYTDTTTSSYYINVSASASSNSGIVTATGGSANASVTESSIAIGVGYNPTSQTVSTAASSTGTKTGNTVTTTAATANDSANRKIYFKLSGITTSSTNDGMSTYFNSVNSGSSSDKDVTITPKYTATAGYRPAVSTATNNGGTTYWKIKTTSATQGTSTISNNTVTRGRASWGTGWITTDDIRPASFSNTATADVTYLDISNTTEAPVLVVEDNNNKNASYLYINQGYTDNLKISLGKLLADNATITGGADYSSNQMLSGYTAYDKDGKLFTGNIPTKTANDLGVSGKTITVPTGYYASNASASVKVGTITSGAATISSATYTYDSTNARFKVTGSANVSAPTVNTAGYVSSTEGTKNANNNGAVLNTTVAKIAIKATMSGTPKVTPTISKIATASGNNATNITACVSAATITKPTSGYYVAVQSGEKANTVTATSSVVTAGYGTSTSGEYSATNSSLSVGANASAVTYLPITGAILTFAGGALSTNFINENNKVITVATTDDYNNGLTITSSRAAVTYTNTAGYIPAHSTAQTASAAPSNQINYLKGVKIPAPSSGTAKFDITVPNGNTTDFITFQFTIDSSGNVTIAGPN